MTISVVGQERHLGKSHGKEGFSKHLAGAGRSPLPCLIANWILWKQCAGTHLQNRLMGRELRQFSIVQRNLQLRHNDSLGHGSY
jgi:hypothetical protein